MEAQLDRAATSVGDGDGGHNDPGCRSRARRSLRAVPLCSAGASGVDDQFGQADGEREPESLACAHHHPSPGAPRPTPAHPPGSPAPDREVRAVSARPPGEDIASPGPQRSRPLGYFHLSALRGQRRRPGSSLSNPRRCAGGIMPVTEHGRASPIAAAISTHSHQRGVRPILTSIQPAMDSRMQAGGPASSRALSRAQVGPPGRDDRDVEDIEGQPEQRLEAPTRPPAIRTRAAAGSRAGPALDGEAKRRGRCRPA